MLILFPAYNSLLKWQLHRIFLDYIIQAGGRNHLVFLWVGYGIWRRLQHSINSRHFFFLINRSVSVVPLSLTLSMAQCSIHNLNNQGISLGSKPPAGFYQLINGDLSKLLIRVELIAFRNFVNVVRILIIIMLI